MVEAEPRDMVLLALSGDDPEPGGDPGAFTAVELADRLEMGTETMADRIDLLSTLSELIDDGLVDTQSGRDGRVYALTDAGLDRAASAYRTVADDRVEVRNGTSGEVPLEEVDRHLQEPAVARALSRLTDDDVLYLSETVEAAFVDRDEERDRLAAHVDETRVGDGRVVMVTGEAGVGKTTLVAESLAREDDLRVLDGVVRTDTDEPYQAVREAIEPALEASPFDRPTFDLDDPDDLRRFRVSLFADVANDLLSLAADRPVVLFLEDLHNAGTPTIELVDSLARRVREGKVLVVVTARVGAEDDGSQVRRLADEVIHHPHERLDLAPFDRERTRELIEATLGTRPVPAGFVDLVYDHTGGTPLFVVETCSWMQDRGIVVPEHDVYPTDPDALEVSDTVVETIETRLDVLDDPGRRVVTTAALLGEEFEARDLETVSELDRATIREYLDVLVDIDVLRWIDVEADDRRRLRFRSSLFQETVVGQLSGEQRDGYHRRIATTLAEWAAIDPGRSATVAHHFERAGDHDRALEHWLAAAEHAESVYAHELAREHYERALELARDRDDDRVLSILESVGDIAVVVGDHEEARRSFEYVSDNATELPRRQRAARKLARVQLDWEGDARAALETVAAALALTESDPPSPEECRLLLVRQSAASRLGDPELAHQASDAALELADELDDRRMRARAMIGRVELRTVHDLGAIDDEIVDLGRQAVAIWETLEDDRRLAEALVTMGTLYGMIGEVERSLAVSRRALELNEQIGDRMGALNSRYMIVNRLLVAALNGDHPLEAVIDECDEVIAEARDLGNDSVLLKSLGTRGVLDWQGTYDYQAAVERMERSVELGGGYDHWAAGHIAVALAAAHRDAGAFDRTRAALDDLLERDRSSYDPKVQTMSHVLEADLALREGATGAALDGYDRAREVARETDFEQGEVLARAGLVDALLAAGHVEAAADETDWLQVYLADAPAHGPYRGDEPFTQVSEKPTLAARRALGRAARERGEHDLALRVFETGLESARDQGDLLREATFLFELAATRRDGGDQEAADASLDDALSVTADLGAFGEELRRRYRV